MQLELEVHLRSDSNIMQINQVYNIIDLEISIVALAVYSDPFLN